MDCTMKHVRHRRCKQTEEHTSPQGPGVKRSHTSCSLHRWNPCWPTDFTGSLIVRIYHPCHWCGFSQRPLKTKDHHPKPDVPPNKVFSAVCHWSIQSYNIKHFTGIRHSCFGWEQLHPLLEQFAVYYVETDCGYRLYIIIVLFKWHHNKLKFTKLQGSI